VNDQETEKSALCSKVGARGRKKIKKRRGSNLTKFWKNNKKKVFKNSV
jgi:hypothetical protein